MKLADAPDVLKVDQVAKLLNLSRGATYEAIRRNEIPSLRLGRSIRVSRRALEDWLGGDAEGRNGGPTRLR